MKRYIWTNFYVDTLRNLYLAAQWEDAKRRERERLAALLAPKHGPDGIENKVDRYLSFKPPDLVVMNEFQPMLIEAQEAYVCGHLYPALTGACCIGERILNLLLLKLRDYFKTSEWYRRIYAKESFDDWDQSVRILRDWRILSEDLAGVFEELKGIRHQSIHFQELSDLEERSITALKDIIKITDALFGMRRDVLFMEGHLFIKKEKEQDPLVKEFYIPSSFLVGYKYQIETHGNGSVVNDENVYEDRDVTDEEFIELMRKHRREV